MEGPITLKNYQVHIVESSNIKIKKLNIRNKYEKPIIFLDKGNNNIEIFDNEIFDGHGLSSI